jgi:hypothetical protein
MYIGLIRLTELEILLSEIETFVGLKALKNEYKK